MHKQNYLYGIEASVLQKREGQTTYRIKCDTKNGIMKCISLFPGIEVATMSFRASYCSIREKRISNMLEIAFCKSGRYECKFRGGHFTCIGEGDIAISILSEQKEEAKFPTGNYTGVALLINLEMIDENISQKIEEVSVDWDDLINKYCKPGKCAVIKREVALQNAFKDIYECNENEKGYLRIKVLEILFLLSKISHSDERETRYYSGDTINKIYALKVELMRNLSKRTTLEEWAEYFDIGLTTMKESFKAEFGKSIYSFQKEYKMQVAAELLHTTDLRISEIAEKVGYSNPYKFSMAFKKQIGCSPKDYRNKI